MRLGVEVRVETGWHGGASRGGLCRLRGVPVVLVDAASSVPDRIGVLCEALAGFDIETVFLPPALRARIRAARR